MNIEAVLDERRGWVVVAGDCRELELPDGCIDAVVCDPPYELGFMGKKWDSTGVAYDVEAWRLILNALKPGGHLLAFGGTRTYHRMACAIEDAGFEIRDCLQWLYGSGFPKSLDVGKAIDKGAGAEREVVGVSSITGIRHSPTWRDGSGLQGNINMATGPATDAAKQWDGWGTGLKPANEPIVLARKPFVGTVTNNVQQHGTAALNIDATRIDNETTITKRPRATGLDKIYGSFAGGGDTENVGRWPTNVLTDEEAAALLDEQSGERPGMSGGGKHRDSYKGGMFGGIDCEHTARGDTGGASRFFYTAKASRSEREDPLCVADKGESKRRRNRHPTVKPVSLMRWLCRLITPPGGVVLDPFCGSGSTGIAALSEGFRFIGGEDDEEMAALARSRIAGGRVTNRRKKRKAKRKAKR